MWKQCGFQLEGGEKEDKITASFYGEAIPGIILEADWLKGMDSVLLYKCILSRSKIERTMTIWIWLGCQQRQRISKTVILCQLWDLFDLAEIVARKQMILWESVSQQSLYNHFDPIPTDYIFLVSIRQLHGQWYALRERQNHLKNRGRVQWCSWKPLDWMV